jgi:hypothetical protein
MKGYIAMPSGQTRPRWSREGIVDRIKSLHRKGTDLSYNSVARREQGLLAAANYHFGGWATAVGAAGLDYARDIRKVPRWTRDRIVARIQTAHEAGADLSWTSVTRDKRYSALAYAAIRDGYFGAWDDALQAAGIDPAQVRRYESWTPEKIIRRVKARAKKGLPLNSKAMQDGDSRLFNAALHYFGAWSAALEAAGCDPRAVCRRRRWSTELVIRELKGLRRQGEDLSGSAMRKNHSRLYSAACKYFGSWTSACEASGISARRRTAKSRPRKKRR